MTKHSPLWLLVPVTAALLVLSGCAPSNPSPTSSPTTGGNAAPSATPTPTATTVSNPVPRVQVKCASVFTAANVASWVSDPAVTLKDDETTPPSNIMEIAADQLGTLSCVWGGANQTDGSYDNQLALAIATDAADPYDEFVEQADPQTAYSAGDKSEYGCIDQSGQFQCIGNVLVGTTWASVFLQNNTGSSATKAALIGRMKTILDSLAGQLGSAPASLPAWTLPASSSPGFCIDPNRTTIVRTTFGNPALKVSNYEGGGGYEDAQQGPTDKYIGTCTWVNGYKDHDLVEVDALQGGAWSVAVVAANPPYADFLGQKYAPVTIAGADNALVACGGSNDSCDALVAVKGNLYAVTFPNKDAATNSSRLTALVAHFN
jgi:hypothetical protein